MKNMILVMIAYPVAGLYYQIWLNILEVGKLASFLMALFIFLYLTIGVNLTIKLTDKLAKKDYERYLQNVDSQP